MDNSANGGAHPNQGFCALPDFPNSFLSNFCSNPTVFKYNIYASIRNIYLERIRRHTNQIT